MCSEFTEFKTRLNILVLEHGECRNRAVPLAGPADTVRMRWAYVAGADESSPGDGLPSRLAFSSQKRHCDGIGPSLVGGEVAHRLAPCRQFAVMARPE